MILQLLRDAEIPGHGDEYRATGGRETWRYWLYRVYDCTDRLLYIGCAADVVSRMQVHSASWDKLTSVVIDTYGARLEVSEPIVGFGAARAAERAAIREEAPLLNKHHNLGRSVLRSPEAWTAAEAQLIAARQCTRRAAA